MTFPLKWDIYKDNNGKWHWRHYRNDAKCEESTKSFALKSECLLDAKMHGYKFKTDDFDLHYGNQD